MLFRDRKPGVGNAKCFHILHTFEMSMTWELWDMTRCLSVFIKISDYKRIRGIELAPRFAAETWTGRC